MHTANQPPPKPSRMLIAFSWLFLMGCVCLASLAIALFIARAWDPCAWVTAIIFGIGATAVGWAQYAGVFCGNRNAASLSLFAILAVGALALFALIVTTGEFLLKEARLPPLSLCAMFLLVALVSALGGWLNWRWIETLSQVAPHAIQAMPIRFRLTIRGLLMFTAAVGLSLAVIVSTVRTELPQTGVHLETEHPPFRIPAGAKDICWRQGSRGTMTYEFTLGGAEFRTWVAKELSSTAPRGINVEIEPITAFRIMTYASEYVLLTDGLVFTWNEEDRGVHAAWDRKTNRVYFDEHWH